jgi:hypothetical protein
MLGLWRARALRPAAREALILAVVLTLLGLALRLPSDNQTKFFNLLFLLLAAPAGLALVRLWDGRGRAGRVTLVVALALGVIPTTAICYGEYAFDRGQRAAPWERPTASEREALAWAASSTPRTAILLDGEASLDMLLFARRSTLWGGEGWGRNWSYPVAALERRESAMRALGALQAPDASARALLGGLGREVWVVGRRRASGEASAAWTAATGRAPGEAHGEYRLGFRNAEVALWRWEGAR